MKRLLAAVWATAAIQAFAAPVASEPFESTTAVSSEVRAQAAVEPETTFWLSAMTWNAGVIDVLRRVLTGMGLIIK